MRILLTDFYPKAKNSSKEGNPVLGLKLVQSFRIPFGDSSEQGIITIIHVAKEKMLLSGRNDTIPAHHQHHHRRITAK